MNEIEKIREDLNNIVKSINLKKEVNKKFERKICILKLFNDEVITVNDKDSLWDLLSSYRKCGQDNFVKDKKLVDEYKLSDDGEIISRYTCIIYELEDGSKYRLFINNMNAKIISNYYNLYKKQNLNKKEVK